MLQASYGVVRPLAHVAGLHGRRAYGRADPGLLLAQAAPDQLSGTCARPTSSIDYSVYKTIPLGTGSPRERPPVGSAGVDTPVTCALYRPYYTAGYVASLPHRIVLSNTFIT